MEKTNSLLKAILTELRKLMLLDPSPWDVYWSETAWKMLAKVCAQHVNRALSGFGVLELAEEFMKNNWLVTGPLADTVRFSLPETT